MCLKLNPAERITPEEVYFHPYFDEFERKYKRKWVYILFINQSSPSYLEK